MLYEAWKEARTLLKFWILNLKSAYAYKTSFYMQVIFMMLNNSIWLIAWYMMFSKFTTIAGFQYPDYLLLWVICCRAFSFVMILWNWCVNKLGDVISQGWVDTYLLLPGFVLPKIVSRSIEISAIGDFFFSVILILFIPSVSVVFFVTTLIVSFLSAIVIILFMIFFQSLSFWIWNSAKLADAVFQAMIWSATYPPKIFDTVFFKVIIVTILPVYFTSFLPYALVKDFSWMWFGELLLAAACALTLGTYAFKKWLRRYESGNAITLNVN